MPSGIEDRDPAKTGAALFQALFQSSRVNELFQQSLSWGGRDGVDHGLRLRLRINPADSELTAFRALPWELLYRKNTEDFLALSAKTPVVRSFDVPRSSTLQPFEPPLRVLLVLSEDPRGQDLRVREELQQLREMLEKNPQVRVELLENPDPWALRPALLRQPFHVLHYMGHGIFDPESEEGALLFRGPRGTRVPLSGRHLATKLKDLGSLRLVTLNACDTARSVEENPFAGLANALLLGGIPAVVAMKAPVRDKQALAFSRDFYQRLAAGRSLEEAMSEGRQAIHSLDTTGEDWAIPILFLGALAGDLFTFRREVDGSRPIPGSPPSRYRWRLGAAVGFVLLLGGAVELVLRQYRNGADAGIHAMVRSIGKLPQSQGAKVSPPPKSISPAAALERVQVGDFHFQVSGDPRTVGPFREALQQEARRLVDFGIPGRTVRITLGTPHIESSNEAGLSSKVCSLAVTDPFYLGPVTRAQADETAACRLAAKALAEGFVDRLANE
jgi:CHAT domain